MGRKEAIFWDVDTQRDFLSAGGRLYVPGAAKIVPAVSSVRKFARGHFRERGLDFLRIFVT